VNTLDPGFFIKNIQAGYEMRKVRKADKEAVQIEMDASLYSLIKNSHQIVNNRGKALSFLGGERKRKRVQKASTHVYNLQHQLSLQPLQKSERLNINPFSRIPGPNVFYSDLNDDAYVQPKRKRDSAAGNR